ncbi:hypothetical protein [Halorussus caseinilyticus]|uniref:Uncharacterized protein n=1 Tax=Halorussus caseinilyticus TaxID=3034025 RepID=A0ABD5WQJ9_9EURY|nr:hypothetical protein [Halorussus sp. DT72]
MISATFAALSVIPWSKCYVGLSAVGAALVGALWVGAYPFILLSDAARAAFLTTMFGVSALVHHYYARRTKLGAGEAPPETERRWRRGASRSRSHCSVWPC